LITFLSNTLLNLSNTLLNLSNTFLNLSKALLNLLKLFYLLNLVVLINSIVVSEVNKLVTWLIDISLVSVLAPKCTIPL
jgi:hypothetical protein